MEHNFIPGFGPMNPLFDFPLGIAYPMPGMNIPFAQTQSSHRSSSNPPSTVKAFNSESKSGSNSLEVLKESLGINGQTISRQQLQTLREIGLSNNQIHEIINCATAQHGKATTLHHPMATSELIKQSHSNANISVGAPPQTNYSLPTRQVNSVNQMNQRLMQPQ